MAESRVRWWRLLWLDLTERRFSILHLMAMLAVASILTALAR